MTRLAILFLLVAATVAGCCCAVRGDDYSFVIPHLSRWQGRDSEEVRYLLKHGRLMVRPDIERFPPRRSPVEAPRPFVAHWGGRWASLAVRYGESVRPFKLFYVETSEVAW